HLCWERPADNSCFGLEVISSLGAHLSLPPQERHGRQGIDSDKVCFIFDSKKLLKERPRSTRISMWTTFAASGFISGYKTIADNPPAEFVAGKENETE